MTAENKTPAETMAEIVALRQVGKMAEAADHFVDHGVLVLQPGHQVVGRPAVLEGLVAMSKVFPVFHISERTVIISGSVALHHSRWHAQGVGEKGEPTEVGGVTADVLQRQPDGRWMVLIDNPWGGAVLG